MATATGHGKRLKAKDTARSGLRKSVSIVTVGELRSNFKAVEAKLAKGLRVQITRRGEIVAEIQAPAPVATGAATLPDFEARMRKIWGEHPLDIDTTAMISEGR